MGKEKESSDTMRAAYIGAAGAIVAALITTIITLLPKQENVPQPSVAIYKENSSPVVNGEASTTSPVPEAKNSPQSKHMSSPNGTKALKNNQNESASKAHLKTDSANNKLNDQQTVTSNIFSPTNESNYGEIQTDNDAAVAFYADPTDNIQPKGYISSGTKVLILKVSLDKSMVKIQANDRIGWIPIDKIHISNNN